MMGPVLVRILEIQDEADLGLAFVDEQECLSFLDGLERERDENDTPKYPFIASLDRQAFVARWRMALTRTPATIRSRATAASQSSAPVRPQPMVIPSAAQKASRNGRYFGPGAVTPGRGHSPGLVDWSARTTTARFSEKERDHLEYVLSVYNQLGDQGTAWHATDSASEAATREAMFLHRIQRFVEDLSPKISAWKRWTTWCREQIPCIPALTPKVVSLGSYLMMRAAGGKTAAAGQRNQLRWWTEHVGVPLPIDHPALEGFRRTEPGHIVDDGDAPEPWMVLAIMKLAIQDRGTVSLIAAMFTLLAGTCLRWRHIQRAHLYDTTANAAIFWIAKGKTCKGGARHPFLSPSPRYWFRHDVANRNKSADAITHWSTQERVRTGGGLQDSCLK